MSEKAQVFRASEIKLKRARQLLVELEALNADYVSSGPVTHEVLPSAPGMLVGFKSTFRGAPDEYGAIVGDLIHNLRAALDLMACDLVRARGEEIKDVHFPFCHTPEDLDTMIKRRRFDRAGIDAVALLKSIGPYPGGDARLRAIHDLDIQDKHQELIPTGMSWVSPTMKIDAVEGKNVKISVIESSIDQTQVQLVFPAGSVFEGQAILPILRDLIAHTDVTVQRFRATMAKSDAAVD